MLNGTALSNVDFRISDAFLRILSPNKVAFFGEGDFNICESGGKHSSTYDTNEIYNSKTTKFDGLEGVPGLGRRNQVRIKKHLCMRMTRNLSTKDIRSKKTEI